MKQRQAPCPDDQNLLLTVPAAIKNSAVCSPWFWMHEPCAPKPTPKSSLFNSAFRLCRMLSPQMHTLVSYISSRCCRFQIECRTFLHTTPSCSSSCASRCASLIIFSCCLNDNPNIVARSAAGATCTAGQVLQLHIDETAKELDT